MESWLDELELNSWKSVDLKHKFTPGVSLQTDWSKEHCIAQYLICYLGSDFLLTGKAQALSEWKSSIVNSFVDDVSQSCFYVSHGSLGLEVGITGAEVTLTLTVHKLSLSFLKVHL